MVKLLLLVVYFQLFTISRPMLRVYSTFIFISFCLLSSCSSSLIKCQTSTTAFQTGDLVGADNILSEAIEHEMPPGRFEHCPDAVCLLLNRALVRFALGEIDKSISDFDVAIQALEYYRQNSTAEALGQTIFEDDFGAYQGQHFEHILARAYFALALIHKGDFSNAYALLRAAEEMQQNKKMLFPAYLSCSKEEVPDIAFSKYLFAVLLENRGDKSNASLLYQQAKDLSGIEPTTINTTDDNSSATVVLVCHNGNIPFKVSGTSPASIASTVTLEILLKSQHIDPSWSAITGIPVPVLCQKLKSSPSPTYASIDGTYIPLNPYADIAQTAYTELEIEKPIVVARGVARYLLRRSAVAYCHKRNENLGALVDLGMLIANINTKADTRSWSTLPCNIDIARCILLPGDHQLKLIVDNPQCRSIAYQGAIHLERGDLCIINIFNIHPGISRVLIPKKFISKGDDT